MPARDPAEAPDPRTGDRPSPKLTVVESLRRQAPIAILPVIVLVGIAMATGLARTPEYKSESRLNVGGLSLTEQSAEGYTYASQQLALAYARGIQATRVIAPTARATGLSQPEVSRRISADPIQNSPVVRVRATGQNARQTQVLADTAAGALRRYAGELNSGRTAGDQLLNRYRDASADLRNAQRRLAGTPPNSSARRSLQSRVDLAQLEKRTVGYLYGQSQTGQATSNLVQQLAPATRAKSDRAAVLQDYIVAAILAGLVIGVGIAVLRANADARRRMSGF